MANDNSEYQLFPEDNLEDVENDWEKKEEDWEKEEREEKDKIRKDEIADFFKKLTLDESSSIKGFIEVNKTSALTVADLESALNTFRVQKATIPQSDDRPLVEKLRGKSLKEKEALLTEAGLYKSGRNPFAPQTPDRREGREIPTSPAKTVEKLFGEGEASPSSFPSQGSEHNIGAFDDFMRERQPIRTTEEQKFRDEQDRLEADLIKRGLLKKPLAKKKPKII